MSWAEFQIELAIRLSLEVCKEKDYVAWANKWLSGEDRTAVAASNAAAATSTPAYDAVASIAASNAAYAASTAAYASASSAYAAASAIRLSIAAGAKLESVVRFL